MAKKQMDEASDSSEHRMSPVVAATLAGVIYQSKLLNRAAKLNIPEQEIISDVIRLWHTVMGALSDPKK